MPEDIVKRLLTQTDMTFLEILMPLLQFAPLLFVLSVVVANEVTKR
jgi:hypothetical protein